MSNFRVGMGGMRSNGRYKWGMGGRDAGRNGCVNGLILGAFFDLNYRAAMNALFPFLFLVLVVSFVGGLRSPRMSLSHNICLIALLAFTALPSSGGQQGAKVLTNYPPAASIVRFEVGRRMPTKWGVWQRLSQKDGEFILSATQGLQEWKPKWPGGVVPFCNDPPPNDFA